MVNSRGSRRNSDNHTGWTRRQGVIGIERRGRNLAYPFGWKAKIRNIRNLRNLRNLKNLRYIRNISNNDDKASSQPKDEGETWHAHLAGKQHKKLKIFKKPKKHKQYIMMTIIIYETICFQDK